MIGTAYQRSRLYMREAHLISGAAEFIKFLGRDVSHNGQMPGRRPQYWPSVSTSTPCARRSRITPSTSSARFTQPQHQARLRRRARRDCLACASTSSDRS